MFVSSFKKKAAKVAPIIITIEITVLCLLFYTLNKHTNTKVLGLANNGAPKDQGYLMRSWSDTSYYEPEANSTMAGDTNAYHPIQKYYTINTDTLNERFNYPVEKPKAVFRIVTLGDSHTFGTYVNTKDNWTEVLEDLLNSLKCTGISRFEVINLGISGYDPEYIKERYKRRGEKYNPDLIIWHESGFDFERIDELVYSIQKEAQKTGGFVTWEGATKEINQKFTYEEIMAMEAKSWWEFYNDRKNTNVLVTSYSSIADKQKELLRAWAEKQKNVSFFFNLPSLNTLPQTQDSHPTEEGHKEIANSLLNYLRQSVLKTCK